MDFEWIPGNVAGPGVDQSQLEEEFEGCKCIGTECSPASGCSCLINGKANYDEFGNFLINDSTLTSGAPSSSSSVHLECSDNCECALAPRKCANRRIQTGVQHKLRVSKCPGKGFGVFAAEKIAKGQFVVEYVGEVIGQEEAERRLATQNDGNANANEQQHNYLFTIREFIRGECRFTFIDGRHKGNLSRFINHSCEPNLHLQVFRLGRPSPSLAMFAARDIQEGEELSYSYGFQQQASTSADNEGSSSSAQQIPLAKKPCLCGAPKCQGRLPSATAI